MISTDDAEALRCLALENCDRDALERLLADDFLYVHASGRTEDKQAYIASVTSGAFRFEGFRRRDVKVSRSGATSVMSGTITVDRREDGSSKSSDFTFVGVWVDGGGEPRLLFWKHSKI